MFILSGLVAFAIPNENAIRGPSRSCDTQEIHWMSLGNVGIGQTNVGYDGASKIGCGYDKPAALTANEDRIHLAGGREIVAVFAKFLAAEETTSVNVLESSGNTFVVDAKGNVIPLQPGETLTGSPNGQWLQVRDADGNPTGMRLDGGHSPASHPDPSAQVPHAHVPGVTNPNGTPWLPVNQ